MKESVVWELELPEVTLEEVFQAEGADYSRRPPRPGIVELHRQIMAEAESLVSPVAVWCEVAVKDFGQEEVILENGQKLTSRLLVRTAGTAEKLILFTVTIGSAMDNRTAEYSKAGEIMEAFISDAVGTAYIAKSAIAALAKLEEKYHRSGLETTFPMGPGHSYWRAMEDMRTIFGILRPEQVGLKLTESNLILPRKSIAMVIGAGSKLPDFKGKSHCDFCDLQNSCKMRTGSGPIC